MPAAAQRTVVDTSIHEPSTVLTTDSHFRIYRRNGRQIIPLRAPPGI